MIPPNQGDTFAQALAAVTKDCKSVLEVGARYFGQLSSIDCPIKVGIEVHQPYIDHALQTDTERMRSIVPLKMDMRAMQYFFPPKSIDCVMFLDSIEHIYMHEVGKVLHAAEKIARKCVVLWTPDGFMPNERPTDGDPNPTMGGEGWEEHKCGLAALDMKSNGFEFIIMKNHHTLASGMVYDALFGWKTEDKLAK